jgi:iron complex outermembrane receptor protein
MLFQYRRRAIAAAVLSAFALPAMAADGEATLPAVTVKAEREGNGILSDYTAVDASTGALGTKPLLETPYSVSVVNAETIADLQATNLADVYKGDAAVIAGSNGIARENTMITVRGLPVDMLNGFKIDGLNVSTWNADLPLEHFERVELLKGLSSFMYGFAEPGGSVNYVLKRAHEHPVTSLTAGYGTESQHVLAADIARRFGDGRFGLRVNAVHEGGDTYLDTPIRRNSASLAFDAKLTDRLTFDLDTLYQKRKVHGSLFALVLGGANVATPEPIAGDTRLTQDFTYHETELRTTGAGLRWELNDNWNVRASVRSSLLERTNYDSYLEVNNNAGDYTDNFLAWYSEHENKSASLLLNGKFTTGSFKHELVAGTDLQTVTRSGATARWLAYWNTPPDTLTTGNLYTGRGSATDPGLAIPSDLAEMFETRNAGLFISDTIAWTPRWSTIIGLRHSDFRKTVPNGPTYDKSTVTPTLAAIWKPVDTTSVYASYVEGLEEGNTAPTGTVNDGQVFGPLESKQIEFGVKHLGAGWSAETALFRVERGLAYTSSANRFVQEGGLVYHGLDLAGRLELGRDWALRASMVLLRSENKSDDPSVNGKDAANAPEFSASVLADYRVPGAPGLTLTGGLRYVGQRYLEASNDHSLRSYRLFDLGARYITKVGGSQLTVRAGIDNVADEKYWLGNQWGWLTPGAPRTFRISAEAAF